MAPAPATLPSAWYRPRKEVELVEPVLVIAAPFEGGVLVGSSGTVAKARWGLVAGAGVQRDSPRVAAAFSRSGRPGPDDVGLWLSGLSPSGGPVAAARGDSWVFSFESEDPGEGGSPAVGLYAAKGQGVARLSWGAVSLVGPDVGPGVLREGELRFQWDLDRGTGSDARLEAVTRTFAWYRATWEWVGDEVEVGIHERDHRYSVDRVGLRGLWE